MNPRNSDTWPAAGFGNCDGYSDIDDPYCKCSKGMNEMGDASMCDDKLNPFAPVNWYGKRGSKCSSYTIPDRFNVCAAGENTTQKFCNTICPKGPCDPKKCTDSGCVFKKTLPGSVYTEQEAADFRQMCPQTCGVCPGAGECQCLAPDGTPSVKGSWGQAHQNTGWPLKQVGVDDGINITSLPKCSLCIPDIHPDGSLNRLGNIKTLPPGSYCSL